ncbi:MAG: peptide-methionine (R)-S-oxide reductase MsrB [Clostridia bacterium]|nr:peptide-methionine (R)-S-oxide reductase MsrB [Clostridia bacterium]
MKKTFFEKPTSNILKKTLSPIQFDVTQNNGTESPFQNPYWNFFEKGLYVDIITGEPLFSSKDKFESSCGWPSFSKPIHKEHIRFIEDMTFNMRRIEVRSQIGDSHLGHVFDDGPEEFGGMRYCINSASLRFVPENEMSAEGYEDYLSLI